MEALSLATAAPILPFPSDAFAHFVGAFRYNIKLKVGIITIANNQIASRTGEEKRERVGVIMLMAVQHRTVHLSRWQKVPGREREHTAQRIALL